MSNRLADKVAVVTGAGDGMGAAIARRFLDEGAKVVACDVTLEKLRGAHNSRDELLLMAQDVAAVDAGDNLIGATVDHFGGLDILVNNAGVSSFVEIEKATDEDWQRTVEVNQLAVFRLCRRAIPEMKQRNGGRIINIASVNAIRSRSGLGIYSATKAAVTALTNVLAIELGPDKITANAILPGIIMTGISRAAFAAEPRWKQILIDETALGRVGQPEEIAGAALFLASDDASFVSGHQLVVDGGAIGKF
ncbi:SDR family NAD(P)-dependent oxidoreductase [Nitrobacter sp.]|uniref:SDR family NAD(P)-dependent oxidoreductase n=1 Tax=Nitrobacter sp. TaxID=29420 RepID=UPI0029CAB152|nr:SDR family NAD(P)-dependent oxidoreductase [Nitrobacter sp.]